MSTARADVSMEFLRRSLTVRINAKNQTKTKHTKKHRPPVQKNNFNLKYSSKIVSSFVLFDDKVVWLSIGI
jgi:hypothetical protein